MVARQNVSGRKVFLVHGKRTAFGKFGGSLMDITPVDLAVHASRALFNDLKLNPEEIDQVILGNVVPSSTDTMYGARHLALKLGMKISTPGHVVNRLCGSGIQIILEARNLIRLNEAEAILCSGVENMSMVPHLTYGGRFGTKYGALPVVDMLLDALTDKYACLPMGITAENLAEQYKITREECDVFSYESHAKAVKAYEQGHLQKEITTIELKKSKCDKDEHVRADASIDAMKKLRSSFKTDGVVTPGSASGIVDGASSVLIASEEFCNKHKLTPIAEIIDGHVVGVDPKIMGIGPVPAIRGVLEKNELSLKDIDLFEINEAFAAQALACVKELGLDKNKLNIWGGAIAIGHPLAASGTRIAYTLARQLKEKNLKTGIASACIGGGQGISLLIRRV
ncbi:MAG: thiolase family protein [Bacteriovoracaceae bacterium]|nr:thiolase family protein [Bacteriovoracaceae bacterium]